MSSAEPATSKLLVQTLNQFRSGIKQMSTKSNTATGWIRGERREGKQEPKLGTLTTPSSTWTDTRGQARRQTGAEAGDTDRPQLNRLTPQPQAVSARGGGGGGGSLSTCSRGAASPQKLTSQAGASASAP